MITMSFAPNVLMVLFLFPSLCVSAAVSGSPVDCDFDTDLCGYTQLTTDTFDWTRQHGTTASSGTGPDGDHTTGSGSYVYTEATSVASGQSAVLVSPALTWDSASTCVTFWYSMVGSQTGGLALETTPAAGGGSPAGTSVWTKAGSQGPGWHRASVTVDTASPVKLHFKGTIGSGYKSDMAIDDVTATKGACGGAGAGTGTSVTPSTANCDFESSTLCQWTNVREGGVSHGGDWHAQKANSHDNTGHGHFARVTSSTAHGIHVWLVSPSLLSAAGSSGTLSFWYKVPDRPSDSLEVHVMNGDILGRKLWSQGRNSSTWTQANVTVAGTDGHPVKLAFVAILGKGTWFGPSFNVDVDDVVFTEVLPTTLSVVTPTHQPSTTKQGSSPSAADCDFESDDLCGYHQVTNDDLDWERHNGQTPSSGTGPDTDHTLKNSAGHYMYVEASPPWSHPGQKAALLSPALTLGSGPSCVRFWYNMYGSAMGNLSLLTLDRDLHNVKVVWRGYEDQGKDWHQANVTVQPTLNMHIGFEGVVGTAFSSDMAIDDIKVVGGPCYLPATTTATTATTTTTTTTHKSTTTRPKSTVTTSKPTSPRPVKTTATTTPTTPSTTTTTPSTTTTSTTTTTTPTTTTTTPTTTTKITPTTATTTPTTTTTTPTTTTTTPTTTRTTTPTPTTVTTTSTTTTTPTTTTSAVTTTEKPRVVPVSSAPARSVDASLFSSCDFEKSCGFANSPADFTWTRRSHTTPTRATGPSGDHTPGRRGAGYYVYTEASNHAGKAARFSTQEFPASATDVCVQFYYSMYGADMGTLNIKLENKGVLQSGALWTLSGDQHNQWHKAQVNVPAARLNQPFKVVFEGVQKSSGQTYLGDMAVDDILTVPKPCPINGDTSFELISPWENVPGGVHSPPGLSADTASWALGRHGMTTPRGLPSDDHTFNNTKGKYLFFVGSTGVHYLQTAHLINQPILAKASHHRCVSFWFYFSGSHGAGLSVSISASGDRHPTVLWSVTSDQPPATGRWTMDQVAIDPRGDFQIIFEARSRASTVVVALDDIQFHDTTCHSFLTLPPSTPTTTTVTTTATTTPTTPSTTTTTPSTTTTSTTTTTTPTTTATTPTTTTTITPTTTTTTPTTTTTTPTTTTTTLTTTRTTTPTPTTATTKSTTTTTPTTTTSAVTTTEKPNQCHQCHEIQCFTGPQTVSCPQERPLCMSRVHDKSSADRSVVKGCISQSECDSWTPGEFELQHCLQVDRNVIGHDIDCLFCCRGDLCNQGPNYIPRQETWVGRNQLGVLVG